jgi:hypothetical protein
MPVMTVSSPCQSRTKPTNPGFWHAWRKAREVDAVGHHGDVAGLHPGLAQPPGQDLRDGQHDGGGAPGLVFQPLGKAKQMQAAIGVTLGGQGGIDLQQQGRAGLAGQAGAGEIEQIAAFIDDVWLECGVSAFQRTIGDGVIGQFGDFLRRARQQFAQEPDGAAFAAEPGLVVETGADDMDLVAQRAEGADQFLDVHALSVLGLNAMAVEDAHGALDHDRFRRGRRPAKPRATTASQGMAGPQSTRKNPGIR